VSALVAVLVAPFFIDWSNHKATFEREVSALVGHPVKVKGDADAQFLPIPTFTFTNIEIGGPGGEPLMSAARLKLRLELIPLLQRQFDVIDMELDAPQISARVNREGETNWKIAEAFARIDETLSVKLGPVTIREGALYAADEMQKKALQIQGINATISAQSLIGPWKLEGTATHAKKPFSFKISTGKFADGKIRMKSRIEPDALDFDTVLDGELALVDDQGKTAEAAYKGTLSVIPRPVKVDAKSNIATKTDKKNWELSGAFNLNRHFFALENAAFEDGALEAPINLNGAIRIPFNPDIRFEAKVTSRQIDLDRAYGKGQSEPLAMGNAQQVIAQIIANFPKPPIPGSITVDVPGIVVAGDVVRSLHFIATPTTRGWQIDDLGAILPGATQLRFRGDITTGTDPLMEGALALRSDQPVTLARWWRPESGTDARRISIDTFEIDARLTAEPASFQLRQMEARLGASDINGNLSFHQISARQKQFDAAFSSKVLDVDALQALSALFLGQANLTGFNADDTVSLKLSADKLISQSLEGRSASVNLKVANGEIDITTMKIADFAGLNIDVAGTMSNVLKTPAGRFNGTIKAETKEGLLKIGDALAPDHPAVDYLRRYGDALMPLDVAVNFSGDYQGANNGDKKRPPESNFAATIMGRAGGGNVSAGVHFQGDWENPDTGDIEASFNADYTDSTDFLKQFGWDPVALDHAGSATLDIRAKGTPKSGIAVITDTTMDGVHLTASTTLALRQKQNPAYSGTFKLTAEDSEPLMRVLGFSLPASGLGTDVDLNGEIKGTGWSGTLDHLTGILAGSTLKADLAYQGAPPNAAIPWKWQGDITTERVSLAWLSALGTGEIITPIDLEISPENINDAGHPIANDEAEEAPLGPSFWSRAQYGAPYLANIEADLDITVATMDLTDLREIHDAHFTLRLRPQSVALNDVEGTFSSGALSGSLRLENSDGLLNASGIIDLKEADATALLWSDENRPLIEGKLSLSSQFSSTGRSLDALIGTLGGGGSILLEKGRIRRLNPATFSLLVKAADRDITLNDAILQPLAQSHLDAGALTIDKAESTFTLTSGIARLANVSLESPALDALAGATIDLPQMKLNASIALSVDATRIDKTPVAGSTPEIAILFDGPIDQPSRALDLQPLLGYLTVRRFEQEVRRVEVLQADILEKQRLSRYARWISAEEEREKREAIEAEARRLQEEIIKAELKRQQEQADAEHKKREQEAEVERQRLERIRAADEARIKEEAARQAQQKKADDKAAEGIKPASSSGTTSAQNPSATITGQDLPALNIEEELRRLEREIITTTPRPGANRPLNLTPQTQ